LKKGHSKVAGEDLVSKPRGFRGEQTPAWELIVEGDDGGRDGKKKERTVTQAEETSSFNLNSQLEVNCRGALTTEMNEVGSVTKFMGQEGSPNK